MRFIAGGLVVGFVVVITLVGYPIIRARLAGPERMTGEFNVAVAEFGALTAEGKVIQSNVGEDLAQSVYDDLEKEYQALNVTDTFQLRTRPPTKLPRISGATRADRALIAAQLAREIGADLIVYGNLQPGNTEFIPEFYLSPNRLGDAKELAGQYQLGIAITAGDDITVNPVARMSLRERLLARTPSLARFVKGLGYYALRNYDQAAHYFQVARDTWGEDPGGEVLSLFLGNTALAREPEDLAAAGTYYSDALRRSPDYARARLGAAEVIFQRAYRGCEPGAVDTKGLAEALAGYQSALTAAYKPALSNVDTKARFMMGRAHVCLGQVGGDGWAEAEAEAEAEFRRVIADFAGDNDGVRQLASEAHAYLGYIYLPQIGDPAPESKYRRAAAEYRLAIEIDQGGRPLHGETQARSYRMLGYIHGRLGEYDRADQAYIEAIRLAPAKRQEYEQERQWVRSGMLGLGPPATPTAP